MNKRALVLGIRGTAGLVALGLLAACVRTLPPLDPETQAACIREAGITGSYSVTATLLDDRMTYVVGPGPGTRQAQTAVANACIARKLEGGAPGPTTAPAPAMSPKLPITGPECQKRGGVLQGGSGYC